MKVIAKNVSQPNNNTWSECLTMALAATYQTPHAALAGLSTFEALYGCKPVTSININLPAQPHTIIIVSFKLKWKKYVSLLTVSKREREMSA